MHRERIREKRKGREIFGLTPIKIFFSEYKAVKKEIEFLEKKTNMEETESWVFINVLYLSLFNMTMGKDSASLSSILKNETPGLYSDIEAKLTKEVFEKYKISNKQLWMIRDCLLAHLTIGTKNQNIDALINFITSFGTNKWIEFLKEWFYLLQKICIEVDDELEIDIFW